MNTSEPAAPQERLLAWVGEHDVRVLHLSFTDLWGGVHRVEILAPQLPSALDTGVVFDGSSVPGWVRVEEPDLVLRPDPDTIRLLPEGVATGAAQVVCDLHRPDGSPFEGDPRTCLKRALAELERLGLVARIGAEVEFFLLDRGADGNASGRSEVARRQAIELLAAMGLQAEGGGPAAAPEQHRIVLPPVAPLDHADGIGTLKWAVRAAAQARGLEATWMPKPGFGAAGSGLHTRHTLFRGERNAFSDPEAPAGISETANFYVGGLLRHGRAIAALANPLVNSYKRLVPGFGAPTHLVWALHNRSALVRVPAVGGGEFHCELRLPDPAANPYLALAVQIAAGADGIRSETGPGEPIQTNLWMMNDRERRRLRIEPLPRDLGEALAALEGDRVIRGALGEHIFGHWVEAKRAEWEEYAAQVHPWERDRYLHA